MPNYHIFSYHVIHAYFAKSLIFSGLSARIFNMIKIFCVNLSKIKWIMLRFSFIQCINHSNIIDSTYISNYLRVEFILLSIFTISKLVQSCQRILSPNVIKTILNEKTCQSLSEKPNSLKRIIISCKSKMNSKY